MDRGTELADIVKRPVQKLRQPDLKGNQRTPRINPIKGGEKSFDGMEYPIAPG